MVSAGLFKTPSLCMPSTPGQNLAVAKNHLNLLKQGDHVFATTLQPYNRGDGIRFHAETLNEYGLFLDGGFSDFVELSDHLCAQILNARPSQTLGTKYLGEDWLKLEYWISGKVSLVFREFGQIDFDGRWCFAHLHRDQISKGEWVDKSETCTSVTVYCRPAYLEQVLGNEVDSLPSSFREFARSQYPSSLFESLPLTQDIARAVNDLANATHTGNLRRLYVEAKVMELFSATMQALYQRGSKKENVRHLTRSELRRLSEVRDLLNSNLSNPPRTAELARYAAMNQQKLQIGFKQLFGQTIIDFCHEQRLEQARKMLEEGEYTVTQVALDVGYDFANNFSSAFKRRYGISPKAYQKKF